MPATTPRVEDEGDDYQAQVMPEPLTTAECYPPALATPLVYFPCPFFHV